MYTVFNYLIVCILYFFLIFLIAPIVDHLFEPLDKEKDNTKILLELLVQLLSVITIWYMIEKIIIYTLRSKLRIKDEVFINVSSNVIIGVIYINLQTNLIEKLNYITLEHPYRFQEYKDE
tara:strand:+ start:4477 stop:4836 length:360 start_codon:yes stop_codon:yes gene_type:complete